MIIAKHLTCGSGRKTRKGLNALRLLRNEVISVHRRVMENSWESDPTDGEKTLEERLDFINQIYE
uniref:Bm9922 n=1 Tax=Brugia malayi TaxID=6279 RepID=A0A1I9G2J8_BRUMA|nr:Bm9922 [Brugia malayi]